MPEKLKVLFLPHPVREDMFYPWGVDVVNAVRATGNDIEVCDYKAELAPQFAGVDVVIDVGGSAGTEEMADLGAGQVRLWQILGTGLDHFEMDIWRSRGIPVANCPGQFSSVALAEHAMMMILLLAREYPRSQTNLRSGVFYEPVGQELEGKRLVLYGFGASGIELAKRARGFGMRLFAIDIREVSDEEREELGVEFAGTPADLDGLLPETDVLSMHLHLNASTRHCVDARRLALLPSHAWLINVARGALVDEAALAEALRDGRLAGAGIDVFSTEPPDPDDPIMHLPNVIATPHCSGTTDGTSRKRAGAAATNVARIAEGLEPLYRVDNIALE